MLGPDNGHDEYTVHQKVSYRLYEQEQKVVLRSRYPFLSPAQISRKVRDSWNRLKQGDKQYYTKSVLIKTPVKELDKCKTPPRKTKQRKRKSRDNIGIDRGEICAPIPGGIDSGDFDNDNDFMDSRNKSRMVTKKLVYKNDFFHPPSPSKDHSEQQSTNVDSLPCLFESPMLKSPLHHNFEMFTQKNYTKSKLSHNVPEVVFGLPTPHAGILKGNRTEFIPNIKAAKGRVSFSTKNESFQQSQDDDEMTGGNYDHDSDDEYSAMLIRREDHDLYNFDEIDAHSMCVDEGSQGEVTANGNGEKAKYTKSNSEGAESNSQDSVDGDDDKIGRKNLKSKVSNKPVKGQDHISVMEETSQDLIKTRSRSYKGSKGLNDEAGEKGESEDYSGNSDRRPNKEKGDMNRGPKHLASGKGRGKKVEKAVTSEKGSSQQKPARSKEMVDKGKDAGRIVDCSKNNASPDQSTGKMTRSKMAKYSNETADQKPTNGGGMETGMRTTRAGKSFTQEMFGTQVEKINSRDGITGKSRTGRVQNNRNSSATGKDRQMREAIEELLNDVTARDNQSHYSVPEDSQSEITCPQNSQSNNSTDGSIQSDNATHGSIQSNNSADCSNQSDSCMEKSIQSNDNANDDSQSNDSMIENASPTQKSRKTRSSMNTRPKSSVKNKTQCLLVKNQNGRTRSKKNTQSTSNYDVPSKAWDLTPVQREETSQYVTPQMDQELLQQTLRDVAKIPRKTRRSSQQYIILQVGEDIHVHNSDEASGLSKQKRRSSRRLGGEIEEEAAAGGKTLQNFEEWRRNRPRESVNDTEVNLQMIDASGDAKVQEDEASNKKMSKKSELSKSAPTRKDHEQHHHLSYDKPSNDDVIEILDAHEILGDPSNESWDIMDKEYNSDISCSDSEEGAPCVRPSDASSALVRALRMMKQTMVDGDERSEGSSPKLLSPALSGISQMSSLSSGSSTATKSDPANVEHSSCASEKTGEPSLCEMFQDMTPPETRTPGHNRRLLASSGRESGSNFSQLFKSHDIFC